MDWGDCKKPLFTVIISAMQWAPLQDLKAFQAKSLLELQEKTIKKIAKNRVVLNVDCMGIKFCY
jgi:hypothetical protein